jgi:hypothetical protein
VAFCISPPHKDRDTSASLGAWFYGVNSDSEGNIQGLDLPPERLEDLQPALRYFETTSKTGKEISIFADPEDDRKFKNINTLKGICKEIESENILAFTFLRMWQARKNYLGEYARWAQEDVVKAFERLTTSIANCNMEYTSRLIYLPKMSPESNSGRQQPFDNWSRALDAEGNSTISVGNITSASEFATFMNPDSTNLGLEVVSTSTDDLAEASGATTERS